MPVYGGVPPEITIVAVPLLIRNLHLFLKQLQKVLLVDLVYIVPVAEHTPSVAVTVYVPAVNTNKFE
jgi:hypothetical protein